MNASESSNKPSSPEQPSADQRRFAPVSSTIELLTATSEKLYSKLTPRRVDQFLRDSSIVSYGLDTAAQGWNRVKPLVRFVDDCSDRVVGLGVYGYEHLVLESLQSIVGMLKQFYSCETNPFARVSLLFLTAILADPEMMNTISEEDFEQLFRRDPQFGQQHFQTIVKAFYQSVKSHWMGTKDSSHADLVRFLLYVTAATMEQLLIAKDDRVGFFPQKYKDYFFSDDAPKKPSFTRTSFREFTRSTLQLRELTPQLVQMADQYLQIALVLFKLSNLGSRGAVDWLVDSIRFGKRGVDGAFRACRGGFTTIVLKVQVFPQQALAFTCEKAGALATLSREAFVAVSVRASKLQALQYCFELAHKVDLLLRDQGDALLQILRKNRDILKAVVVTYRDELAKFLEGMPERCSQASQQAQQAVLQFLRENASVVLDLAKLSKETLEVLLETTTQFLLTNKQHLTDFCVRYGAVVLEQAKKGKHLAFSVLRVDEIASLVARTFKAAEEYFRIKDSLSKLDRQAEDSEEREPLAASEDN